MEMFNFIDDILMSDFCAVLLTANASVAIYLM